MSKSSDSGMGITSVLLVIFVVLKLTDNVSWSWSWVLSPIWIPFALVTPILGYVGLRQISRKLRQRAILKAQYDLLERDAKPSKEA